MEVLLSTGPTPSIFYLPQTNSGRLSCYIDHLTQYYNKNSFKQQNQFCILVLPGIVELIPEEMELLANKLTYIKLMACVEQHKINYD